MPKPIRRLLIANRGEIAIRILRAANELDIRTVSIYAHEDRFALHRFQADESYLVGAGRTPIEAHLPSPFCRKANNFRGLFAFLRPYVATIKFAYTKKIP